MLRSYQLSVCGMWNMENESHITGAMANIPCTTSSSIERIKRGLPIHHRVEFDTEKKRSLFLSKQHARADGTSTALLVEVLVEQLACSIEHSGFTTTLLNSGGFPSQLNKQNKLAINRLLVARIFLLLMEKGVVNVAHPELGLLLRTKPSNGFFRNAKGDFGFRKTIELISDKTRRVRRHESLSKRESLGMLHDMSVPEPNIAVEANCGTTWK
ncbi:hypothetical protein P152DRAFT_41961 [Eremomyces bilateralis CBS 781.70]|uniref:Uncharacterized protein n=1 Tax=Eremomyces bilateralis CBS 781.70 TaxID=1392243 RepID=A0A6G1G1S2_9PEZI|nr:uncharacterized protein P152DRAFT_41961 [Eremomyces bilateralis CBS 781.70]KAF1812004.1 hypothetical protein P152DRAFT_41961 [Eremomyces bilateralis CBS 781.70]